MSIYDINISEMTADEEAELRCSKDKYLNNYDEIRCNYLCHENCLGNNKYKIALQI